MKKMYDFSKDAFIAVAFILFMVGSMLKFMTIDYVGFGCYSLFTSAGLIRIASILLLFSIALNVNDIANDKKNK